MKKLLFLLTLGFLFSAGSAFAGSSSGCGLGSIVWKGKSGIVFNLLAATTNGTSYTQTFGITTGTSNCSAGDTVEAEGGETMFIADNSDLLKSDMSKGNGEYLTTYAFLAGCGNNVEAFSAVAQNNSDLIFSDNTPQGIYDRTLDVINQNDIVCK